MLPKPASARASPNMGGPGGSFQHGRIRLGLGAGIRLSRSKPLDNDPCAVLLGLGWKGRWNVLPTRVTMTTRTTTTFGDDHDDYDDDDDDGDDDDDDASADEGDNADDDDGDEGDDAAGGLGCIRRWSTQTV